MTTKGVRITAPSAKTSNKLFELDIQLSEIIKIIVHFSKNLQLVFVYTKPSCAQYIRNCLEMEGDGKDKSKIFKKFKRLMLIVIYSFFSQLRTIIQSVATSFTKGSFCWSIISRMSVKARYAQYSQNQ